MTRGRSDPEMLTRIEGHCPVCERPTVFTSPTRWLRGNLLCGHCRSVPRERALAWCLASFIPDWRNLAIHESSPAPRSLSQRLKREGRHYIESHYFPDVLPGTMHEGVRCENLEQMSFADESLDLHLHLDVLEHVNQPRACFEEMERTLKPGGRMIFTTPIYPGKLKTERRALYRPEGITFLAEPEYHGNPISEKGALVTFHYGADLPNLIRAWAPRCGVSVIALLDPHYGILGPFREVFVVTKRG